MRHEDAEALARQAIESGSAASDAALVGRARDLLAEVLVDAGNPQAGAADPEEALAAPDGIPDEVRAGMLGTYSRTLMRSYRQLESIAAADQALDLAEHLGLAPVLAETLNNKGSALFYLGRTVEGQALIRAAAEVAHEGGFVNAEIRALSNLSARLDQPAVGRAWAAEARALAVRIGNRSLVNWTTESLRLADYLLAEHWDQAQDPQGYDEDPTIPVELSSFDEVRRLAFVGVVRAGAGLPVDDVIARLGDLVPQVSDEFARVAVVFVRAEWSLAAGDYAAAARDALLGATDPNVGSQLLGYAAHAALWGGDIAAAREALAILDASPATDAIAASSRLGVRGVIATLEGRPDEAMADYRASLALMRAGGLNWHLARRLLDVVVALGPDDPRSREGADEARMIFERVGARPYLAKLDAALAAGRPIAADRIATA